MRSKTVRLQGEFKKSFDNSKDILKHTSIKKSQIEYRHLSEKKQMKNNRWRQTRDDKRKHRKETRE